MSTDRKEYMRKWREAHKEKVAEYSRVWREKNREHFNELCHNYQVNHREEQRQRMNDYHQTKEGRATNLLAAYVQMDLERRGVRPVLTQADIMRKCFSDDSKCVYCGETSWRLLGLDRINNDQPHDRWNVLCSCRNCNTQRYRRTLGNYLTEKLGMSWEEFMTRNGMTYATPLKIEYYGSEN